MPSAPTTSKRDSDTKNNNGSNSNNRKKYKCRKCDAHGNEQQVKSHKRQCPYKDCTCETCTSVTNGRRIVAQQIALYREQTSASKSDSTGAPYCRRCRNHGAQRPWKGHKRNCPHRCCTCEHCRLITLRKNNEKALREQKAINSAGYTPDVKLNPVLPLGKVTQTRDANSNGHANLIESYSSDFGRSLAMQSSLINSYQPDSSFLTIASNNYSFAPRPPANNHASLPPMDPRASLPFLGGTSSWTASTSNTLMTDSSFFPFLTDDHRNASTGRYQETVNWDKMPRNVGYNTGYFSTGSFPSFDFFNSK